MSADEIIVPSGASSRRNDSEMSDIPPNSLPPDSPPPDSLSADKKEAWRAWAVVFEESAPGIRAFLNRRLTQASDVDDCLQVVYIAMLQSGRDVAPSARRAWLFRVAANESARLWRSRASTDKMLRQHDVEQTWNQDPTDEAIRSETTEQLRRAVAELPEAWREVVRLRIEENLTFQQIADQLSIPLGTALTQMRRALDRLRNELKPDD